MADFCPRVQKLSYIYIYIYINVNRGVSRKQTFIGHKTVVSVRIADKTYGVKATHAKNHIGQSTMLFNATTMRALWCGLHDVYARLAPQTSSHHNDDEGVVATAH